MTLVLGAAVLGLLAPACAPGGDDASSVSGSTAPEPAVSFDGDRDEGGGADQSASESTTTVPTSALPATTAPAPAATSTAPEPGPLAAAPPDPRPPSLESNAIGVSPGSVILDLSPAEQERDLDRMVELGASWVRIDVDWSRVERERGEFDWSNLDGLVVAARQRGLHVLGLLAYTPDCARPGGTPDKAPPIDPDDFGGFVSRAVDRYAGHIRAWEVWNEPNVSSFWYPSPDPGAYATLLVTAATAIRAADPEAVVVTGGLAPAIDDPGRELSPSTFLDLLYDSTPLTAFDVVGVHPYTYPGFPTEQQDWNTFASLPDLRRLMVARGDAETPMWFTEFGAPTAGGARAVADDDQALMIEQAVVASRDWPWAGPLFVYSLRDRARAAASAPGERSAPRPASIRSRPGRSPTAQGARRLRRVGAGRRRTGCARA